MNARLNLNLSTFIPALLSPIACLALVASLQSLLQALPAKRRRGAVINGRSRADAQLRVQQAFGC